jgi:hypothetical protein
MINLAALVERRHARHASFQNCIVVRHAISSLLGKKSVQGGWNAICGYCKRARAVFHLDRTECKRYSPAFQQLRVVEFFDGIRTARLSIYVHGASSTHRLSETRFAVGCMS